MSYVFDLTLKVRDYECDLQGIVNNANYQHYIEHTRHEFLRSQGVSFADLHERGIDAVVAAGAVERTDREVFTQSEKLRKATVRLLTTSTLSSAAKP